MSSTVAPISSRKEQIMEKQFTIKDLERAGERGMIAGQIGVTEDIISQARIYATYYFNAGKDAEALSIRDFADTLTSLLGVLQSKQARLKSKARSAQIADTVFDSGIRFEELT